MPTAEHVEDIQERIVACRLCPRLVEFREETARKKRAAFADWEYWGRPVPSMGPADARLLIVGLAPAAHGGNRTGRIFTGDRSGDFLFATLHEFGFASQPVSQSRGDGLKLIGAYITAAIHCAPPGNRPLPDEMTNCRQYLVAEIRALRQVGAVVALGLTAWRQYLRAREEAGFPVPRLASAFGHGVARPLDDNTLLIGSYHPSQQNTFTGRLTRDMFDDVFRMAREKIGP